MARAALVVKELSQTSFSVPYYLTLKTLRLRPEVIRSQIPTYLLNMNVAGDAFKV